tara:strand:+ start:1262 stop:1762 length:501 start_codon:yes stop_codon:yes gene_type:complete
MSKPSIDRRIIESSVATEVERLLNTGQKSQITIAKECGFTSRNVLTMIKQGTTKMPLDKAAAFARSMDTDVGQFMLLCLREYQPHILDALSEINGEIIDEDEIRLIRLYRKARAEKSERLQNAAIKKADGDGNKVRSAKNICAALDLSGNNGKSLKSTITSLLVAA